MEQSHIAEVDFAETRQLSDGASIYQDLGFVLEVLRRLKSLLEEDGEPDTVLIAAYWSAALVAYVRCFTTEERLGLSESIFEGIRGDADAVDVHRHFKDLRDKHVAHSVNPFEQIKIGLVLSPVGSSERKVEGVATLTMKLMSLAEEGVDSLMALAGIAHGKMAEQCREAQQKVQDVGSQLALDELYAKPNMRVHAPGPEQAGKPRP